MKNKIIIILIISFIFLSSIHAQDEPKIEFEKDTFDFGEIMQNQILDFTFSFKNIGNKPLTIEDYKVSCGCTMLDISFEEIMPGEKRSKY